METMQRGRRWLAAAVLTGIAVGLCAVPAGATRSATSVLEATAALGPCWLQQLGIPLGEDVSAQYYVTRWRAGAIQTIVQGTAPRARYWSLSIYHARRGKMLSLYDQQIVAGGQGRSFTLAIGGVRPPSRATWVDPTVGGADSEGYLIYRLYKVTGPRPALPSVTFKSKGVLPAMLTVCARMQADLHQAIQKAAQAHPGSGQGTGGQPSTKSRLWGNNSPFRAWSVGINPALSVPANNVTKAPLITQLADPNVVYHAMFFNLSWGDLVLHGTLPPISAQAPRTGMRYFSLCAYPPDESYKPLACLDDSSIQMDAHGAYTVVVSPHQPAVGNNWLNVGTALVGAIIMRWLLPHHGVQAAFCLPGVAYRQPGTTTVPALPAGC